MPVGRPATDSAVSQPADNIHTGAAVLFSAMLDSVKARLKSGDVVGATAIVDVILAEPSAVSRTELARAYTSKAILESRAGRTAEGAVFWQKAADAEPVDDLKHGRQAHALICQDRYQEALEVSMRGLTTNPPSSLSAVAALIAAQHL